MKKPLILMMIAAVIFGVGLWVLIERSEDVRTENRRQECSELALKLGVMTRFSGTNRRTHCFYRLPDGGWKEVSDFQ